MIVLMQEGYSWHEAASRAGIRISRSTAYRWFQQFRTRGEGGLHDGRHGQSSAPEQSWQDGAGGLLLVVAAHETGLLVQLETAIAPCLTQSAHPRLSPLVPLAAQFVAHVTLSQCRRPAPHERRGFATPMRHS